MKAVILDNGHGYETPGKRSPEWPDMPQIREWEYARRLVKSVSEALDGMGITNLLLVPENYDVNLSERCRRANLAAYEYGVHDTLLVSVHLNAAPKVNQASGWEIHTYLGKSDSDRYATVFWEQADMILSPCGIRMRGDWSDGDPDWDTNLAILRDTVCPAVLTENLFMNSESDCRFLNSEDGFRKLVQIHAAAIAEIFGMETD